LEKQLLIHPFTRLDNITDRQRPDPSADADEEQLIWRPEMMEHSYEVIRISPNSRQPPAILHVNRESRVESLKFYQLTRFERRFPPRHSIYYNPTVDIVYFGEQSDLVTLNNMFRMRLEIPHVAIVHGDESVTSVHPTPQHPFTVLQILHGLDPKSEEVRRFSNNDGDIRSRDWPGCKGLKTVVFVLPSGIRPTGGNAAPVHFQAATSSELSDHFDKEEAKRDQNRERVRSSIAIAGYPPLQTPAPAPVWDPRFPSQSEIKNLNQGVEVGNFPNWIGDAKPTFYFASLGTAPLVEKIYRTVTIPATVATKKVLEYKNYYLTREIEAETGCSIKIGPEPGFVPPELDEQGRMVVAAAAFAPTREIRFFGSRAQIWSAEQCFKRELGARNREGEKGGEKNEAKLDSMQAFWMDFRRKK
jgi:hypothetical protein